MITVVEGPDCAGKSTLITNAYGSAHKRHFGPPKGGPDAAFDEYTNALAEFRRVMDDWDDDIEHERRFGERNPSKQIAVDRFGYGELVYPGIMNRKSNFDVVQMRMIERVLLSMRAVLIAALPSFETSKELYMELKGREMIQDDDRFVRSYREWEGLFKSRNIGLPMAYYNLETDTYPKIVDKANQLRSPENSGPGIGYYSPMSIVMVGEQVNPEVDIWDWPFVEKGKNGSSYWLTMLLHNMGVLERELYWVNSLDRNGKETYPGWVEAMKPRKLIAMGKPAQIWAKRHQLHRYTKVHEIPHPQFHKRFKSKDPYDLIEILQQDREPSEL